MRSFLTDQLEKIIMAKIQELKLFNNESHERVVNYLNEKHFGVYHANGTSYYYTKEGCVIMVHKKRELISVNIPENMAKTLEVISQ